MTFYYPISDEAYDIHLSRLNAFGNIPGEDSNKSFKVILNHFEDALRGSLDAKYYIAALDPGVGKSQLATAFIRAWKEAGFLPAGGVIVFLSRIDEIKTYEKACGLKPSEYAVVVSSGAHVTHALHEGNPDTAPVLFTTQQMFQAKVEGRQFADLSEYHFKGSPRTLRIWDETIDPAKTVTLSSDRISGLLAPLRTSHPAYALCLDELIHQSAAAEVGETLRLDLGLRTAPTMEFTGADAFLSGLLTKDQAELIQTLRACAGSTMVVMDDNRTGRHLVGSCRPLPDDFCPLFVLDASARLRGTYDAWEKGRGNLVRLPPATISYSNLTVNSWRFASSRSSLIKIAKRKPVVDAVVNLLEDQPLEEWLVIYHKVESYDLRREIEARAPKGTPVHFLHWGDTHGTNAYNHIKRVIGIGLFRFSKQGYRAIQIAAAGHVSDDIDELPEIERGEVRGNLLQAICRSNVRNGNEGICGETEAWLIMSGQADISHLVTTTFPGCQQASWMPLEDKVSVKGREILANLQERVARGEDDIPKNSVRLAVGITTSSRFSEELRKSSFKMALVDLGIVAHHKAFRKLIP